MEGLPTIEELSSVSPFNEDQFVNWAKCSGAPDNIDRSRETVCLFALTCGRRIPVD